MSASPVAASPAQEVNPGFSGDAEMASVAASPAPQAAQPEGDDGDAGDDDLFGDDDDDNDEPMASKETPAAGGDDEDDEDEDDIRPTNRRRRKAVASASPVRSDDPGRSTLPAFDDDEAIEADGDDEDNASETARLAALEYPEDGEAMGGREASPLEAKRIATVALANTTQRFTPAHLARLPLFLRVEPKVFDEEQFKDKRREEAAAEAEASAADDERLKDVERRLRCENTVRWKVGPDGKRRSNARFVRWSDGSWTLQVGKEHFDIAGMDTRFTPGGQQQDAEPVVPTSSQSQSQGGSLRRGGGGATTSKPPQQPLTYLATPDSTSQLFQTLSPLHSNITIQPTSLQSATHRLISQSLSSIRARQSASKVTMSDLAAGERAPEEAKREAERKLLDAERRKRLKKKKERGGDIEAEEEAELMGLLKGRRRTMIDEVSKSSRGKGSGIRRAGGGSTALGADDEEEEEDEGGYDDDADGFIVNDDEDGEEDAEGEEDDDSEEEEGAARKSKSAAGGSKKKASADASAMEVDEELDDMEKLEQEIERKDAARAKAKKEAAAAAPSSTAAASATPAEGGDAPTQRKKQAIVDSEDEE